MFARIKKSGQHQYLQIVENHREGSKTVQRVISTIGRMDHLQANGDIENVIRSLSRFSEKVLLILSGQSEVHACARRIGPSLIFERLWKELGIRKVIKGLLGGRKFEFDGERAIFLTVLHRLFASGSDRSCDKWHQDYRIDGVEDLNPSIAISLSVRAYKVKGVKYADLTWSGATLTNVDVYRNSSPISTTQNDGAYKDGPLGKGGGSATYQVCEAGTSTCSNIVSVSW